MPSPARPVFDQRLITKPLDHFPIRRPFDQAHSRPISVQVTVDIMPIQHGIKLFLCEIVIPNIAGALVIHSLSIARHTTDFNLERKMECSSGLERVADTTRVRGTGQDPFT